MIDKSKKYWTGDSAKDISEWLRLYTGDDSLDVKSVICHTCGGDSFELRVDQNESAIQVKCTACGTKNILLDCGDIWADAKPRLRSRLVCCRIQTRKTALFKRVNCIFYHWSISGKQAI